MKILSPQELMAKYPAIFYLAIAILLFEVYILVKVILM